MIPFIVFSLVRNELLSLEQNVSVWKVVWHWLRWHEYDENMKRENMEVESYFNHLALNAKQSLTLSETSTLYVNHHKIIWWIHAKLNLLHERLVYLCRLSGMQSIVVGVARNYAFETHFNTRIHITPLHKYPTTTTTIIIINDTAVLLNWYKIWPFDKWNAYAKFHLFTAKWMRKLLNNDKKKKLIVVCAVGAHVLSNTVESLCFFFLLFFLSVVISQSNLRLSSFILNNTFVSVIRNYGNEIFISMVWPAENVH